MRVRGLFSIFHKYFTAKANLEEEYTSNLIPPQSIEEFFLVFLSHAKVTPRVTSVTFSTYALVSYVTMSALHLGTLPQGP